MYIDKEKVIIYGTGETSRRLFANFPTVLEYVDFFVDSYSYNVSFLGKEVKAPIYIPTDSTVVIAANDSFYELFGRLNQGYGIDVEKIKYAGEWLGNILWYNKDIIINPKKVRIDASTACQLDCTGCYMRLNNYGGVGKGFLLCDDFVRFLERNPQVKEVELSNNGEPFLNPEIEQIIYEAYNRGVSLTFSNGVNFNNVSKAAIEYLVKYKVRHINISIDGVKQEIYQKYRRNGNISKVIENIRTVNYYKDQYKSSYPYLTWQFVLMEDNEEDIGEAKKWAEELNMDFTYKLDWSGEYFPQNSDKVSSFIGTDVYNRKQYAIRYGYSFVRMGCSQMIYEPQINWDGRLLGCCGNYKRDWGVNVFKTTLKEAVNDEKYRNAVISYLMGEKLPDIRGVCCDCSSDGKRGLCNGRKMWI